MNNNAVMNTYARFELEFNSGKGSFLYDNEGNEYLDFVTGIAVNALGHSHPKMIEAIKIQSEKLFHISNLYWNENQNKLAQKLIDLSDHSKVFFCNSGTESVETALKIARKHGHGISTSKTKIIYFENSFHGRTIGALSVTGQEKYQNSFKPLIPSVQVCKFNDIDSFKKLIDADTCGVIIEPIQGEGGINIADTEFMKNLELLCKENNALLIFDEVQCGIMRTGEFFAYQKIGVIPDIICIAKGLGGGIPIGAVITNDKASILEPGDHGCTFGGNPLVTAVSLSVLDILTSKGFKEEVDSKSQYLISNLLKLKLEHPEILSIKGCGLILGVEVDGVLKDFVLKAIDEKLLIVGAGTNIIRLVPPLNVSFEEIDLFFEKFKKIFI